MGGKRHLIHFKYKLIFIKTDKMRAFLSLVSVVGVTWALPQLQFGGPTDADTRSFSEAETLSGRVPGAPSVGSAPPPAFKSPMRISAAASRLIWTVLISTPLWMT